MQELPSTNLDRKEELEREISLPEYVNPNVYAERKICLDSQLPVWPELRPKARRKDEGPLSLLCEWVVRHQIGLSMNLLLLLALTHICFPRGRRHTRKFFELSYYNAETGDYTSGWDDAWMVFFWIVVFTGLRASIMDYILKPFAQNWGIHSEKDLVRFAEQAWLFLYASVSWSLGMYIMYHSNYWLNIRGVWANWPDREIGGKLKWYILVEYAFWVQQIMVVNIEKRRKDYAQMFTHHVITCGLIFASYGYHHTRVGNVILVLMDFADILLPFAKCLKYLHIKTLPDIAFGVFMVSWAITRHVLFPMVCYSVWAHIPEEIPFGCYYGSKHNLIGPFETPDNYSHLLEPFRNPEGIICFNEKIKWAFLSTLLSLLFITLLWFYMIVKVAVKVLQGNEADDSRSDDEEEEDISSDSGIALNEQIDIIEKLIPIEEEVGVEGINLNGRTRSTKRYKKTMSSASGVTLPGHSDRKELLGRIGCDKGVDKS